MSSYLTFPDQLSIGISTEGHDLPVGNRHFDDEVQMLVLVWLILHLLSLFWFVGDDPLTLPPGLGVRNFSLQEVDPRRHLGNELQLKVSNAEVPPSVRSDEKKVC